MIDYILHGDRGHVGFLPAFLPARSLADMNVGESVHLFQLMAPRVAELAGVDVGDIARIELRNNVQMGDDDGLVGVVEGSVHLRDGSTRAFDVGGESWGGSVFFSIGPNESTVTRSPEPRRVDRA